MFLRRPSTPRGVLAAVIVVAAVAGGCSNAGSSSSAVCHAPGVTSDQVKVGLIYPETGTLSASFSAVRSGVDARLGVANEAGGVHRRKIVYDWRDDQGAPEMNGSAARALVEQDDVFGIIESSVAATGSAQYLAHLGIPVTGLAAEDVWSRYPNMFAFAYTTGAPVDTYGKFVASRGGRRAVVLQTALSAGVSDVGLKIAQSLTSVGVNVVGTVNYTPNADSPVTVARQIVADNADTVVSVIQPADFINVLSALRTVGGSLKVAMATIGYDRQLLRTYGPAMAGVVIPVFYRPFEAGGPAIAKYLDAMSRFAPQVQDSQQDLAMMAYIQTDMFVRGLQEAGACPTRQSFITGLRSVTSYDAGGLIDPIDIKHGLGQQTLCWSFVQVNGAGTAFDVAEQRVCGKQLGT
jgi:branched-chain amino acid transport system substrate-binding protein